LFYSITPSFLPYISFFGLNLLSLPLQTAGEVIDQATLTGSAKDTKISLRITNDDWISSETVHSIKVGPDSNLYSKEFMLTSIAFLAT
jgi:hypothetical protein